MAKNKSNEEKDKWGANLTAAERNRIFSAWIARTKPEDMFPEAYKRAMESLKKAGLI